MKTVYNSNISKLSTKSNSKKINNLKALDILIDNTIRTNKFFNDNFSLNPFNSFMNEFDFFNKKKETNKTNITEKNNLMSLSNENNENEKELKQISLFIDKKLKTKYYSVREFKKGYIISKYYNIGNDKLKNIKTNLDKAIQKNIN